MNTKEFIVRETMSADTKYIEFVKRTTFEHIDKLLATKGGEYSSKNNRFENFNDAGRCEDMPPEKALWYMMLKHFISVRKFVMELVTPTRRSLEKWNEKIDDIITYLILLKAMIRRRTHIEQVVDAKQLMKTATDGYSVADERKADEGDVKLGSLLRSNAEAFRKGEGGPTA